MMTTSAAVAAPHAWYEDGLAMIFGAALSAFGLMMLKSAGLVVGGVAGLALILSYATKLNVGVLFMLLSLPFYMLGQRTFGWAFTLKSLVVAGLLAGFSVLLPKMVTLEAINPLFAAIFGGALCGLGILAVMRHRASVGGLGVLVTYLHHRWKAPIGLAQLVIDTAIILSALAVVDLQGLFYSAIGTASLSLVLLTNHRPGRYLG
ncbi:MAG: YitT family protein [Caulobacter sp.]